MARALRYLRVAFTTVCGICCVLLFVLWVGSHWRWYSLRCGITNQKRLSGWMEDGVTAFSCFDLPIPAAHLKRWEFESYPPRSLAPSSPMNTSSDRLFLYRSRGGLTIGLPTWALAIAIGMLGTTSRIRWSNRFSIRTLLLATTAVATLMGLVVCAAQS